MNIFTHYSGRDNWIFWQRGVSVSISILLFFGALVGSISTPASADGGVIPFYDFNAYEPGQKAICAWNGEEEIMILSVDIFATKNDTVLHLVPFPSLPEVSLGNFSAFEKVNEILKEIHRGSGSGSGTTNDGTGKSYEDIKIEFNEIIGPHDITAVKIDSTSNIKDWVSDFLTDKGVTNVNFPEGFENVIAHYLQQNINYFVFDVIEVNTEEKSIDPIVYKFDTDNLFFPLVISSIIDGASEITLVFLTPNDLPINHLCMNDIGFRQTTSTKISHYDLVEISPVIGELISSDAVLTYYDGIFMLDDLNMDIKIEAWNNINWMYESNEWIYDKLITDCNGDNFVDFIFKIDNKFSAVNGKSGDLIWQYEFPTELGAVLGSYLIDINSNNDKGILCYYGDQKKYTYKGLFLINCSNGNSIWENQFWEYYERSYKKPNVIDLDADGNLEILILFENIKLFAFNIENGTVQWKYYSESEDNSDKRILKYICYDINGDSKLEVILFTSKYYVIIRGDDSQILWRFDIPINDEKFIISGLGKEIFDYDLDGKPEILTGYTNGMWLLNGEDGTINWNLQFNDIDITQYYWPEYHTTDIESNGQMEIFFFRENEIYAIDGKNGTQTWCREKIKSCGSYGQNKVDFFDLNNDGINELVYSFDDTLFVFNSKSGQTIWRKDIKVPDRYFWISKLNYVDINHDSIFDIIFHTQYGIFALNGKDGSSVWEFESYDYIRHDSSQCLRNFHDFDNDGKFEYLAYNYDTIFMVNCDNGSEMWNFPIYDRRRGCTFLQIDYDVDGKSELIIYNSNNLSIINPKNGEKLWRFNIGFPIYYVYLTNNENPEYNSLNVFSKFRAYSVDYQQIDLKISSYQKYVKIGDVIPFVLFTSYFGEPISDLTIDLMDFEAGGEFSEIFEVYPGVHTFTYLVPNTTLNLINITVEAVHKKYLDARTNIILKLQYDADEEIEAEVVQKPHLKIHALYSEIPLKPGDNTVIILNVTVDDKYITDNITFKLMDNEMGGNFTEIVPYGENHFLFFYTVPYTTAEFIDIFIFASHNDYSDAVALISLPIKTEIPVVQNESNEQEVDNEYNWKQKDLRVDVSANPGQLEPGRETAIIVQVSNEGTPVEDANVLVFESGFGGRFSEVTEYNRGVYTLTYKLPMNIDESISSITLFLYISHTNYSSSFEFVELALIHKQKLEEEEIAKPDIISVSAYPTRIKSGETSQIFILINNNANMISSSDFIITFTDDGLGGSFDLLNPDGKGLFVYEYSPPDKDVELINITVTANFKNMMLESENVFINLEIEEDNNPVENQILESNESDESNSITFFSSMFLILIIAIILGLLGFNILRKKKSKRMNRPKKGLNNKKVRTNLKKTS